jgi:hypothetical protein
MIMKRKIVTIIGKQKKKSMNNSIINYDIEREYLTDFIYLLEEEVLIDEKIRKEFNKKPAEIIVLNKDKLKKQHENKHNALPF